MSVSRSYYAMFTAARAMLLKKGMTPRTHKGVIKKFGEEYIKTGVFPDELGKAFSYVESLREIGDYGISISDIDRKDSEKALNYARRFVEEVEKYLVKRKRKREKTGEGRGGRYGDRWIVEIKRVGETLTEDGISSNMSFVKFTPSSSTIWQSLSLSPLCRPP